MPVTWRSSSGASYTFTVYSMDGDWNDVPGVYVFARPAAQGSWDPLYIGQCDSFKNRMCPHDRWDEAVQMGANSVHVVVIQSAKERDSVEREMIQSLDPPMNTHHRLGLFRYPS